MIDISNKTDYQQTSIAKNLVLKIGATEIDNTKILSESMTLAEILMAEEQLTFGGCNASQLGVSINLRGGTLTDSQGNDISDNLVGQSLEAKIVVNEVPCPLGKFTINSATIDNSIGTIKITALDDISKFDVDITEWYDTLSFPMTIKALRDSLFTHLGIVQESVSLPLDSILIYQGYTSSNVSGKVVIKAICEVNGRFGKMNRNGIFEYKQLNNAATDVTNVYREIDYENFSTNVIDGIIATTSNGTLFKYGTCNNPYNLNNDLASGMNETELNALCSAMLSQINTISYVPTDTVIRGLPYVETGDRLKVNDTEFYVFHRSLEGIQSLLDTISCEGEENLKSNLTSVEEKILELNRETSRLNVKIETTGEGILAEVTKEINDLSIGSVNLLDNSVWGEDIGVAKLSILTDESNNVLTDESNKKLYA